MRRLNLTFENNIQNQTLKFLWQTYCLQSQDIFPCIAILWGIGRQIYVAAFCFPLLAYNIRFGVQTNGKLYVKARNAWSRMTSECIKWYIYSGGTQSIACDSYTEGNALCICTCTHTWTTQCNAVADIMLHAWERNYMHGLYQWTRPHYSYNTFEFEVYENNTMLWFLASSFQLCARIFKACTDEWDTVRVITTTRSLKWRFRENVTICSP